MATHAVQILLSGEYKHIFEIEKKMINSTIIEGNKELAREIIELIKLPKPMQVQLNQLADVKGLDLYKEWEIESKTTTKLNDVALAG